MVWFGSDRRARLAPQGRLSARQCQSMPCRGNRRPRRTSSTGPAKLGQARGPQLARAADRSARPPAALGPEYQSVLRDQPTTLACCAVGQRREPRAGCPWFLRASAAVAAGGGGFLRKPGRQPQLRCGRRARPQAPCGARASPPATDARIGSPCPMPTAQTPYAARGLYHWAPVASYAGPACGKP